MQKKIPVGPPTLTTSKGFGRAANLSCQAEAATLRAAESAWWSAPTVRTWKNVKSETFKTGQELDRTFQLKYGNNKNVFP